MYFCNAVIHPVIPLIPSSHLNLHPFVLPHIFTLIMHSSQVVAPMAANYPSAPAAPPAASSPFSWVPRQMLSGDAAEEEGESDGDSDRGDEDRGEGDEAELVIDLPNE